MSEYHQVKKTVIGTIKNHYNITKQEYLKSKLSLKPSSDG